MNEAALALLRAAAERDRAEGERLVLADVLDELGHWEEAAWYRLWAWDGERASPNWTTGEEGIPPGCRARRTWDMHRGLRVNEGEKVAWYWHPGNCNNRKDRSGWDRQDERGYTESHEAAPAWIRRAVEEAAAQAVELVMAGRGKLR